MKWYVYLFLIIVWYTLGRLISDQMAANWRFFAGWMFGVVFTVIVTERYSSSYEKHTGKKKAR